MSMLKRLLELTGFLPSSQNGSKIRHVTANEAATMLEKGEVFLLDVRSPQEFCQGYIKSATLIPVGDLSQRTSELYDARDSEILVYCQSGMRSRAAASVLSRKGFDVVNLKGGITGWLAAGKPIERGRNK